MITTKNYRNSNEITITNSATLGKVYGDTYTATITLDISKILNEINRYSNLALKTYLQLKYSSVNYGAVQTLHASYGNTVIFNGSIDTSLSYIILDLTNAISNYTSGAFTINLSLSSYGYDPYTGTMDPYTSYLSFKTENNPQDDTKPIIFFKKADEVHSNYNSKIESLPLSFGGNTLIDLFDSNVKQWFHYLILTLGHLKCLFH